MKSIKHNISFLLWCCALALSACGEVQQNASAPAESTVTATDPLPSWNEGPAKESIINFVQTVADSSGTGYVPEADRIAVFDNDGTLWPEQPYPNQLAFAFSYVKNNAAQHPDWQQKPIVKALMADDMDGVMKAGKEGLMETLVLSHSNMTTEEFDDAVQAWMETVKDPKYNQPYNKVIYQPMLEALDYLRAHGFKTFIVSGGGADFMRVWTEEAYGIPPYQVIGSYNAFQYEVKEGKPMLTKLPENILFDDKAAKPVAIRTFIGKQPIACFGNSDGDQAMMQYTSASEYPNLCVILHHTDGEREYAYDTNTLSGHLETALVEAKEKGWTVVNMKEDWNKVFPFE